MRAIIAIATTNVQASKTKAVLAPTVANKTPPTSGPTMLANVPKPASRALDEGSSSGSSRRAGQVSSAGRLNVYSPADRKANTYSGQQQRCASDGVERHQQRHPRQHHVGDDHEPAPVHRVGGRTPDDREHEDGHQLDQTEHADGEDRARDREDLERHDHRDDRVAEVGDAMADEQAAVLARYPQRRQVHHVRTGALQQASARRRVGAGCHGKLIHGAETLARPLRESLTIERMFGTRWWLCHDRSSPGSVRCHGGTKRTAPRPTSCTSRRSPYPPRRGASAVPRADRRRGSGCACGPTTAPAISPIGSGCATASRTGRPVASSTQRTRWAACRRSPRRSRPARSASTRWSSSPGSPPTRPRTDWSNGPARVSAARIRHEGDVLRRIDEDEAARDDEVRSVSWSYRDEGRRFEMHADLPAAQGATVAQAIDRMTTTSRRCRTSERAARGRPGGPTHSSRSARLDSAPTRTRSVRRSSSTRARASSPAW